MTSPRLAYATPVRIETDSVTLRGDLVVPPGAKGIVVFAHGSGSSRHSPRNRFVADSLQDRGLATLLFDLLTDEEERLDQRTRRHRFDIGLLTRRLVDVADWIADDRRIRGLDIGCFGSSTGAAAALLASAERPRMVQAVVSRGGRPDLAGSALERVRAPTLLIVGELDGAVVRMNHEAMSRIPPETTVELEIVSRATHLFPEDGALETVAALAGSWFVTYLGR